MAIYKSFDELVLDMKREILDKVQSKETMNIVGSTAVDLIYRRVKSGKGVSSDTSELPETTQLKALSQSYKDFRSGKVQFRTINGTVVPIKPSKGGTFSSPVTGEFGSPNKSNLTLTGQMLDSMRHKVVGAGKLLIEIPETKRTDGMTNAEVAQHVREVRPFFNLSRGEALVVSKTLTSIIDNITRLFSR